MYTADLANSIAVICWRSLSAKEACRKDSVERWFNKFLDLFSRYGVIGIHYLKNSLLFQSGMGFLSTTLRKSSEMLFPTASRTKDQMKEQIPRLIGTCIYLRISYFEGNQVFSLLRSLPCILYQFILEHPELPKQFKEAMQIISHLGTLLNFFRDANWLALLMRDYFGITSVRHWSDWEKNKDITRILEHYTVKMKFDSI